MCSVLRQNAGWEVIDSQPILYSTTISRGYLMANFNIFPSPHHLLNQPINLLHLFRKVFLYIKTQFAKACGG
jgi:hypothetical protein